MSIGPRRLPSGLKYNIKGRLWALLFKVDNQQLPTVLNMELCFVLCNNLDGRGAWGQIDTCRCMAEFFCCPLGSVTILLTGYTVIQNQNLLEKEWVVGKGEKTRRFLQSTEQAGVGRKETEECEGNYGKFLFSFKKSILKKKYFEV